MIIKDILREVIISQRKSLDNLDLGIPREKCEDIKIEESFAVIITGIRRCGKSTLLNQILRKQKTSYYLNLEDPRLEGFELADFNKVEEIMEETYGEDGIYFFDEIQNVNKWEKFIRYLVDRKKKVMISGSNAALLSTELGTKLTGRHLQIEIFPFSFREFLTITNQNPSINSFQTYSHMGGFPEYVKRAEPEILHELFYDIVAKDIAVRFGIKNTSILNKMLVHLISNVGKEFSYNSIKKTFYVKSVQSVIDYISYFENAYLIFTIPRFSYSYKQQQVNPKKVYSIDNGFSYNNSATFSKDIGKMLENLVFLALRRKFKEIFYFKETHECDFVIKQRDKIIYAIQVCSDFNEETKNREINGLLEALRKFNLKEGIIITHRQKDQFIINDKRIIVKPAWEWLLEKQ